MQNVWFLIYCFICFALVKYILYRMKVKRRVRELAHPLAQGRKFYEKIKKEPGF